MGEGVQRYRRRPRVANAVRLADRNAVEAGHAAAEIDVLGFQPDATGLAVNRTLSANEAGVFGNPNLEEGEARDQPQQCAHWTECVAKHPAMSGAQPDQPGQEQDWKRQRRQRGAFHVKGNGPYNPRVSSNDPTPLWAMM